MKKVMLSVCLLFFAIVAWAQSEREYHNPVIAGFHPDPSCVRVGDDYYVVNSSFQYFPGVPIFHSRDLVHWEQIGNVLTRKSQLPLKDATSWLGIYAPTIRYHKGTFYMITTNVGNGGNFLVTATDPRGPWSEPVWLQQQGIDPSLMFEGDTCWMVSNPDGHITLCQIDPKSGRQLTPSKAIWDGTGGRYPEGPHLYKKDGYYYLLISEGGTELAHGLTIARSRNIYGPYEACPRNPIMTNCNHKGENKQIQGTGHGDFVQDTAGNWWVVFLAYRNFGGAYHHLGRETCLAPVTWNEGEWPTVYGGEAIDTVMRTALLPATDMEGCPKECTTGNANCVAKTADCAGECGRTYDFTRTKEFGLEWIHLGQPVDGAYALTDKGLKLKASVATIDGTEPTTWIGLRQTAPSCIYTEEMDCGKIGSARAGLTVYQINSGHADLCVVKSGKTFKASLRLRLKSVDTVLGEVAMASPMVMLRVVSDGLLYKFYVGDGAAKPLEWKYIGQVDCPLLSTEVAGGFTGVTIGMYCNGNDGTVTVKSFDINQ